MSGGLCLLAVLVIVCVFSPDPIVSQCTTKYCDNGDNEANVLTMVSRLQQQLAEQEKTIGQMQREITSLRETQNASCSKSCQRAAHDCTDLLREGNTLSGVYSIHVPGTETVIPVYCDMETDGGGWLVFQRRQDGSVDFYRDWNWYKRGFGAVSGNFWLGNEYIHDLTSNRQYKLRVDLEDFEDESRYAAYSTFAVSSEAENYTMTLGIYNGTAGDSLAFTHNNNAFSTKDRDNDHHYGESCARDHSGGWWYNTCTASNLNGFYYKLGKYYPRYGSMYTGTYWRAWHGYDSLKRVEMKIRS